MPGSTRWEKRPEGSTWGDWGPDDQLGRLNLLDESTTLTAAKEIKDGKRFCLCLPLDLPGGEVLSPGRPPPKLKPTGAVDQPLFNMPLSLVGPHFCDIGSDDLVELVLQHSSQWDALSHMGRIFDLHGNGKPELCYYNGFVAEKDVIGPVHYHPDGSKSALGRPHIGALKLGVENMAATPIQGRGVMIDLEKRYGRERKKVSWKELEGIMKEDGIVVEKGDMLFFYTGYGDVVVEQGANPSKDVLLSSCSVLDGRDPGLHKFATENGIVAFVSDNYAVEAYPEPNPPADPTSEHTLLGLHEVLLFKLGCYIGELWWLTDLAKHLRETKRYRFFVTAPPLRLPGAVGSPANAVATT